MLFFFEQEGCLLCAVLAQHKTEERRQSCTQVTFHLIGMVRLFFSPSIHQRNFDSGSVAVAVLVSVCHSSFLVPCSSVFSMYVCVCVCVSVSVCVCVCVDEGMHVCVRSSGNGGNFFFSAGNER